MSWGYWGIVTGLALLLGISFFSMALLYTGGHRLRGVLRGPNDESAQDFEEHKRAA